MFLIDLFFYNKLLFFFFIILSIIALFLLLDLFNYIRMKRLSEKTKNFLLNKIQHVLGVCGKKGKGKTTFVSGTSIQLDNYLASLIFNRKKEIASYFKKNVYDLEKIILESEEFKNGEHEFKVYEEIKNELLESIKKKEETKIYESYRHISVKKLLIEFIEIYALEIKDIKVFCNEEFIYPDGRGSSYKFEYEDMKINLKLKQNDFKLNRYSIFYYDEATLDVENLNTNWRYNQKKAMEEGLIRSFRLFRQYYKETSYFISTLQNYERLEPSQRELYDNIIKIKDKKHIHAFNTLNLLKNTIIIPIIIYEAVKRKFLRFNPKKRIKWEKKYNMIKKIKRKMQKITDFIQKRTYILYKIDFQPDASESKKEKLKIVYKAINCYYPVYTFMYAKEKDSASYTSEKKPEQHDTKDPDPNMTREEILNEVIKYEKNQKEYNKKNIKPRKNWIEKI